MKSLRFTLAFALVITIYFAYVMLFTSPLLFQIYQVEVFDPMHRYLAMVGGSLLVVIALGNALALVRPVKYSGIIIVLILYHLARFIVDLILVAQGGIGVATLLPEMVYFVVVAGVLVRFFPQKASEEALEKEKVDLSKTNMEVHDPGYLDEMKKD
ncbi:hypothetical protein KJ652_00070 [Patescibacteria group bacterium]|nr:hypothetical protein [Patescibacteria group bacterium]MBU1122968.1 hypothetical protein [Patescibacteria group bacterium]MBU1911181.1 hypothetical protein [Patescibacteria group bacterium]